MTREKLLQSVDGQYDVLVVGGGATGLGIAVDASTRGFRTLLVEAGDFAEATSSRATKLVHGGVRYLASGQIPLVYEALRERRLMSQNAPHLVHPQAFVTPAYRWWELPWYGVGLKLYDLLSGRASLGPTRLLGAAATRKQVPGIATKRLKGSVLYHDGQFDDARYALALARTAEDHGATVLSRTRCRELNKTDGRLTGAVLEDGETGQQRTVRARLVINAAGIFSDAVRHLDPPEPDEPAREKLLSLSRGTHIVVGAEFLGQDASAIMVPNTPDGRVIFAIPWGGKVLIGTTDVPVETAADEPGHTEDEIAFLIETVNPYLERPITRADILSVFSGLRPLVTGTASNTARLSREHHLDVSASGLVTIAGGKWTTYRRMAEQTLDFAAGHGLLEKRPCQTRTVRLHGAPTPEEAMATARNPLDPLRRYGTDAAAVRALQADDPSLAEPLDPALPFTGAEVVYAALHEKARTVEDVLSRRMRALLLDAGAAVRMAPAAAALLARELGRDESWQHAQVAAFSALAQSFYTPGGSGKV